MSRLRVTLCIVMLGAVGCVGGDDTTQTQLAIHEDPGVATGTLAAVDGDIQFEAREVEPQVFDLGFQLNGLTYTYTIDRNTGVIETDGFVTETGADTQFGDADRAGMLALAHALDGVKDASPLVALTRQIASGMAEFPDSLDLRAETFAVKDRSYTSVCWAVGSYQAATHDDWDYNRWDDKSTLDHAWLAMNAAGPCNDGTYFYKNGAWVCYEEDHDANIEYAYGNCFGRCGSGCGSSTQFTWDCVDHDECVRTGHDTASLWCDDEFSATVDDWADAPNC